jgi:hypothetical protein
MALHTVSAHHRRLPQPETESKPIPIVLKAHVKHGIRDGFLAVPPGNRFHL